MKYAVLTAVFVAVVLLATCLFGQSPVWQHRFNGSASGSDAGYSITQGDDGATYVAGLSTLPGTGSDFFVMSLSEPGVTNWTFATSGSGWWELAEDIVYGVDGNIYAAGSISDGLQVASLTATGDTNWTYQLTGSAGEGYARAVIYGDDGNIYVAGGVMDTLSAYDFAVVSLSDSGTERWVYTHQGAGNWWDRAYDLAWGLDGNIYAAGYSNEVAFQPRWFVVSLDTAGNERWTWDSYMPGVDCNSIAYGTDNNLYVCGQGGLNFAVVSLDTGGAYRWEYALAGGGGYGTSIAQGGDGRIYAAGNTQHVGGYTLAAVCLDTSGSEEWVFKYDTTAFIDGRADGIVYGADGNLYVGGAINDTGFPEEDFIVLSLDSLGTERWSWMYDQIGEQDWCEAICGGVDGNIYATGRISDSITSTDILTVCFDILPPSVPELIYPPDDTILGDTMVTFEWHPSTDSGSHVDHYIHEYDTDSVFSSPAAATPQDTFVAAVIPDTGTYYWRVRAVDAGGNEGENSAVWSFRVGLVGVEESHIRPRSAALSVEGNPTLGLAVFRLSIPEEATADLSIYDAAGRLVDVPLHGRVPAGSHRITWAPEASGIYFYKFTSKHLSRTGKLVVF